MGAIHTEGPVVVTLHKFHRFTPPHNTKTCVPRKTSPHSTQRWRRRREINTTVVILKSSPTHGICKTRDFHIARRHADKKGERGSGDGRCCGRPRRRRHRCPFLRLLFNRDAITADATHPRVTATSSDTYRFPIQDRRRWSSSLD
jgi:hypothetical protein